ncbi:ANTAR domain-containing protein [Mycolicibacterium rutilum]|uniref:ANTAR domain-containing protein n=1 Tax=Mycolicibacterium rutilum TaxID=370526 RepID=A0A1H6JW82_MYCRU|nr:ANTAR domain-containing protein [Mycolicibacterium rutilum]SEH64914.1 ANTAR domain-containing protein [Mycolicibacterium rutilum]
MTMSPGTALERAEGVLIALRRCAAEEAFAEIVGAARRHRLPTAELATALVRLAAGDATDGDAGCAARYEWSSLLHQPSR